MKTQATLAITLLLTATGLRAQGGSLTPPPGPPAPVMRTLDELYTQGENIDTRAESIGILTVNQGLQITEIEENLHRVKKSTPIRSLAGDPTALYLITAPGHYHLDADITGESGKAGIRINAQNVTIDLNSHTLSGVTGSTKGIEVNLTGPVTIRGGTLRNWPQQAVHIINADYLLQDLQIVGTLDKGVESNGVGVIERVTVKSAKNAGLYCNNASPTLIRDCRVEGITSTTGSAIGIFAPKALITRCTVSNITGSSASSAESDAVCGISASDGKVQGCVVRGIVQNGGGYCFGVYKAAQTLETTVHQVSSANAYTRVVGILGGQVSSCSVTTLNANFQAAGIDQALAVQGCTVRDILSPTGSSGIGAETVTHCTVINTSSAVQGVSVSNNTLKDVQTGIYLSGGVARDNVIYASYQGINVSSGATVIGNTLIGTSAAGSIGIEHTISTNPVTRIEDNLVRGWGIGIRAQIGLVRRNGVGECTTAYTISANMTVVPITALGTNPNANISY